MPCSRHACARLSRWRAFPPSPSPSPPPPPTPPGHPFACGLTLDRITGYTVDEHGREAFVTANPLSMLRKALQLRRMAAYFDTDAEFWDPGRSWPDMPLAEWDEWFQVSPPPPPRGWLGHVRACASGAASPAAACTLTSLRACPAPQPGISLAHQESSGTALHREYVLQPVDGRALYSRCGTGQKLEEDEPASEMDFQLDVIAVRLSSA